MKRITLLAFFLILSIGLMNAADEKIQLKGKLNVVNRIHPELNAGGKVYELLIPRFIVKSLKDGEEISVEGTKTAPTLRKGDFFAEEETSSSNREFIAVEKITARGKTLDVTKLRDEMPRNRRMMGHRNGMGMPDEDCPNMGDGENTPPKRNNGR